MKIRYYILTALIAYFVLLLATVPAGLFADMINDNTPVTVSGLSGSIWQGEALLITPAEDIQLKKTRWSFAPLALLTGRLAFDIETRLLDHDIRARAGTSFLGRLFVSDLHASLPAREVAVLANIPLAQLDGMIRLDIDNAWWQAGQAPLANGSINWDKASITVAETVSLGNIHIELSESGQDMLQAAIANEGGEIKISGQAELLPEERYRLDLTLRPTAGASNNVRQSLAMFARKQKDGAYLLKKSGTLNQIGFF